jgi:hypothetical protein
LTYGGNIGIIGKYMAKKDKKVYLKVLKIRKRTSIGSGMPRNKHKRRQWKPYNRQGRKH